MKNYSKKKIKKTAYKTWNTYTITSLLLVVFAILLQGFFETSFVVNVAMNSVIVLTLVLAIIGLGFVEVKCFKWKINIYFLTIMILTILVISYLDTSIYVLVEEYVVDKVVEIIDQATHQFLNEYVFLLIATLTYAFVKTFIFTYIIFVFVDNIENQKSKNFNFLSNSFVVYKNNLWLIIQINLFFFIFTALPILVQFVNYYLITELSFKIANSSNPSSLVADLQYVLKHDIYVIATINIINAVFTYFKIASTILIYKGYMFHDYKIKKPTLK